MSTGTAERPHTLYIPPAPSVELSDSCWGSGPTSPQCPMPVPHPPGLAPSVDSIGSCSLDVNATGTLSPATMEAIDGSRRSLRSISLDNHLSCGSSPPVTPVRPILKPAPLTDPGGTLEPARNHKPPSYLGISCAVSGYSKINRYDSVLREGFRSRDASPARLAFSRSRDSSPMRPEWRVYDPLGQRTSPQATAAKIKELKEQLAKCASELPSFERQGRQGSTRRRDERTLQGRSISVDRGYLTKASEMNGHSTMSSIHNGGPRVHLVEINMNDTTSRKSNNYEYSFERRIVREGKIEAKESTQYSSNNNCDVKDSPISKSFIQSRIERLYGPSALAAGFRSRRSTLEKERQNSPKPVIPTHDLQKENGGVEWDPETPAPEGMPSVFRHLRPEFRTQLPVRRLGRRGSRDSPTKEGRQIPIQLESTPPSTPEIDIPVVPLPEDIINRTTNNNIIDIQKKKLFNGENGCVDVRDSKINITAKQNGNACMKDSAVHPVTENGDSSEVVSSNVRTVSVSSVNGVSNSSQINGSPVDDPPKKDSEKIIDSSLSKKVVKDGHYFLKVVADEVARIEAEVAKIDALFEENSGKMTEEVRGKVLAGTGKAKLLISQKIKQFCGLCQKNIANDPSEEFPTTDDDLAGFWDMVYIQVEDIWANIKAIHALRDNNWQEVKATKAVSDKTDSSRTTQKKSTRPKKASAEKSEESKARDEARKKMMEERRRAMKEAMKAKKAQVEAQNNTDAVELFVPES